MITVIRNNSNLLCKIGFYDVIIIVVFYCDRDCDFILCYRLMIDLCNLS